jgi:hypothetical protein
MLLENYKVKWLRMEKYGATGLQKAPMQESVRTLHLAASKVNPLSAHPSDIAARAGPRGLLLRHLDSHDNLFLIGIISDMGDIELWRSIRRNQAATQGRCEDAALIFDN